MSWHVPFQIPPVPIGNVHDTFTGCHANVNFFTPVIYRILQHNITERGGGAEWVVKY